MSISLRIRPFLTDKDDRFENGYWEERGTLNVDESLECIKAVNWQQSANVLQQTILENEELDIYKIIEPAFNLHNSVNEAELFICAYEDNFFDLDLSIPKEGTNIDSTEISGLSFSEVEEYVNLFYDDRFNEIKQSSKNFKSKKSEIKELLKNRYEETLKAKKSTSLKELVIYAGIALSIYLISKMF
ncbi:hypothetical protein [Sediminitomix flava]|uniref:Uncharacterized protein n=1 Tax=Sediminitomix flava TaxID=379075 RepID=A0A315YSI6_SEDFL|nr:hypothetical protein [Sediminitomix flava]PWJ31716.1 hypothetical protein BC781_1234 [Sediminitomix flava]